MHSRVLTFCRNNELDFLDNDQLTMREKMNLVKEKLTMIDSDKLKNDIFNDRNLENGSKLRTYRKFKDNLGTSHYVRTVKFRDQRRVLSNFRCGALPLAIETGRYTKPPTQLHDRLCQFCDANEVESEIHFLIECNFYSDIRESFFDRVSLVNNTFKNLCSDEKFIFIISCDETQISLAKILTTMFKRRKQHL